MRGGNDDGSVLATVLVVDKGGDDQLKSSSMLGCVPLAAASISKSWRRRASLRSYWLIDLFSKALLGGGFDMVDLLLGLYQDDNQRMTISESAWQIAFPSR